MGIFDDLIKGVQDFFSPAPTQPLEQESKNDFVQSYQGKDYVSGGAKSQELSTVVDGVTVKQSDLGNTNLVITGGKIIDADTRIEVSPSQIPALKTSESIRKSIAFDDEIVDNLISSKFTQENELKNFQTHVFTPVLNLKPKWLGGQGIGLNPYGNSILKDGTPADNRDYLKNKLGASDAEIDRVTNELLYGGSSGSGVGVTSEGRGDFLNKTGNYVSSSVKDIVNTTNETIKNVYNETVRTIETITSDASNIIGGAVGDIGGSFLDSLGVKNILLIVGLLILGLFIFIKIKPF